MKCEVEINGTTYVPKESVTEGQSYVIVRTYSAGVFAGFLKSRNGKEVILNQARRLWRWAGAASLSQLAMDGTSDPDNCKFPCEVDDIVLTEAIEVIAATEMSRESIAGVKTWIE